VLEGPIGKQLPVAFAATEAMGVHSANQEARVDSADPRAEGAWSHDETLAKISPQQILALGLLGVGMSGISVDPRDRPANRRRPLALSRR
jgi:hypothetical protein